MFLANTIFPLVIDFFPNCITNLLKGRKYNPDTLCLVPEAFVLNIKKLYLNTNRSDKGIESL